MPTPPLLTAPLQLNPKDGFDRATVRGIARIEKINSKYGDSQPNGAHGTINPSLGPKMWHGQVTHGYLVVWDDCKAAAFVVGSRIRKLPKE
jgi:hypothetical protein